MMLLLPSMAAHAQWQKWEPTIGGRFPREAYEDIITRTTRIMSYLTFMSYTMNHPPTAHLDALRARKDVVEPSTPEPHPHHPHPENPTSASASASTSSAEERTPGATNTTASDPSDRDWLNALASVLREIAPSHHNIVSTLMLLSNSLFSGHSLPPFLPLPRPYEMTRTLLRLDRRSSRPTASSDEQEQEPDLPPLMVVDSRTGRAVDGRDDRGEGLGFGLGREHVLDPEHLGRPGYAEFAVLEICSTLVCDDLEGLIRSISGLVGVVDFSYRVDRSESSLGSAGGGGGKGKVD
jgi:hypothetical protein